jgi:hypothetical protein
MKYYDMMEQQIDVMSQAVELLLLRAEEQLPLADGEILRGLRQELFMLRTERVRAGHSDVPESIHPPMENVRLPRLATPEVPAPGVDGASIA